MTAYIIETACKRRFITQTSSFQSANAEIGTEQKRICPWTKRPVATLPALEVVGAHTANDPESYKSAHRAYPVNASDQATASTKS
jgi:hypothetical protein